MNKEIDINLSKKYPRWAYYIFGVLGAAAALSVLYSKAKEIIAFGATNGYSLFWEAPFTSEEYDLLLVFVVALFILMASITAMFGRIRVWAAVSVYGLMSLSLALVAYASILGVNYPDDTEGVFFAAFAIVVSAFNFVGLPLIFFYVKFIRKAPENDSSLSN